ncbi:MAG: hydantoinase/oxoprolinase family protein [Chloroflexi bacterium]|nr:hydantoinase/oxoprolinase family protein [Chloroflexota bacterium]
MGYTIGIDTGGTFTDCVVVDDAGHLTIGKALSTPRDFSQGVIDSLGDAAATLGLTAEQLLQNTDVFGHGTTVATNMLLMHTGVKTGLITTRGFEDTMFIGRVHQKVAGLKESDITYVVKLDKAAPLVSRQRVRGVTERVDYQGKVLVPLDKADAAAAIDALVKDGVEAIAICLLWSFMDPQHEQEIKAMARQSYPNLFVTASSDLSPRMGEYERMATTVLNAYLGPVSYRYFQALDERLRRLGLKSSLLMMQCSGGVLPIDELKEKVIYTLGSGPVGGVSGARFLGQLLGHSNILCTDVGGTSFDVGLVAQGEFEYSREAVIDKYHTQIPTVDVASIGTGGGSIAWIEPVTGVLRVGPQSAGSEPGPACYDRGGELPALTDASLILGYINPDYFLGGKMRLNPKRAFDAVEDKIAGPLGKDVHQAAAGIFKIATSQLADLVRKVSIERGYDPRDFVMLVYGGAGPQYAGVYGADIGVKGIIIPPLAAAFSAFGVAASRVSAFYSQSLPLPVPTDVERLKQIYTGLERRAGEELTRAGLKGRDISLLRFVEMRYRRQVHVVRVSLSEKPLSAASMDDIVARFEQRYEELYGKGSGFRQGGIEMVNYIVMGVGGTRFPSLRKYPRGGSDPAPALKSRRRAYFEKHGGFVDTDVFEMDRLQPGNAIAGQAIIEAPTTIAVIHPGQHARVDEYKNVIIEMGTQK